MPDGIILDIPVVIKARQDGDTRIVEVEASNESVDAEGDVILQSALLRAAPDFIKSGHLDIDHLSELGHRVGIADPESYIIGRPKAVTDLGEKRTGVVGIIMRSNDGKMDVVKNRFDSFWKSLQSNPPVEWQASIYGFPLDGEIDDCRKTSCDKDAKRFLVRGINWRSLAFTRSPVNQSLKGHAKIVTAKAFCDQFIKDMGYGGGLAAGGEGSMPAMGPGTMNMPYLPTMPMPRSLDELWGSYVNHVGKNCSFTKGAGDSVMGYRDHFTNCCGADPYTADVFARALMYDVIQNRRKKR